MSGDRNIFAYLRGTERACVDPVRVQRLLYAELGRPLKQALEDCRSTELHPKAWSAAVEQLIHAVLVAFDLPPFDPATGQGTTENDAKEVLTSFLDFCAKKKASPGSTPTSPPPMGPPP